MSRPHSRRNRAAWLDRILLSSVAMLLVGALAQSAHSKPLVTYITGETMLDGPVIFRVQFDSAVKDSAILTIVAYEKTDPGFRLDNIDFVPGSGFSEVVVTAQTGGDGALTRYNIKNGMELADVIASTNAVVGPPPASRPASIVPNPAGTHYYYTENQFGFAGPLHRMMQVPIDGGVEKVVYNGAAHGLVEFSGVEIIDDRMYFFAHDLAGPAAERQLYSVGLDGLGIAVPGAPDLEVFGLDRSSAVPGPGPGISDGSDEMDFDPSTGLLYGTNIGTGETIGFDPTIGPAVGVAGLSFYIDPVDVTAAAGGIDGTFDGLGLLSGIVTPGAIGPVRQIDGVRPDGDGHIVVIGHDGVIVSIDVEGPGSGDIIRLFNRDVPIAGETIGFLRDDILGFDDHTVLAPVPEPATIVVWSLLAGAGIVAGWRRRKSAA